MKLNLHAGEELANEYHESEMVLAKPVLFILLALYLPWFFALKYDVAFQYRGLLFLWTLLVLAYGVRAYTIWSFNRYIITSLRLIRISHEGLFKRVVMETPLERILNVSYKTTGFISSLLKFGDVEVQVVGLMEPIILKNIKDPQGIKDYVWSLHQEHLDKQQRGYTNQHIAHLQEEAGYTKKNQKVL
jgi:PH (Pleckstrin Homology) domain-containing protein